MESSPDAIVMVSSDGLIKDLNGVAERVFQYTRQDLLDRSVEMLLPERLRPAHVAHRHRYFESPQQRVLGDHAELSGLRRDGSEVALDISLTPIRVEGETLAVAHIRDVTDRRRAARELFLARMIRAREDEQLRIASELNDQTIQAIAAAGLRLEQVRGLVHTDPESEALEGLQATVQLAIGRLRKLTLELLPPALERDGLESVVRILLARLRTEIGIDVVLEANLPKEPEVLNRVLVYRVLQEALSNVRKHSRATVVRVSMNGGENGFRCIVADNGVGFDPSPRDTHLGLVAMHERADLAHGSLQITSAPGQGTIVDLFIPPKESGKP